MGGGVSSGSEYEKVQTGVTQNCSKDLQQQVGPRGSALSLIRQFLLLVHTPVTRALILFFFKSTKFRMSRTNTKQIILVFIKILVEWLGSLYVSYM